MIIDLGIAFFPIERELTILLIALLFDGATRLLLPNFRDRMAPIGGIVAAASLFMQQKLNRDYRDRKILLARGTVALIVLLGLSYGAAIFIDMLIASHPRGQILSVLVIFSCLGVTMPWTTAPEIISLLKKKNIVISDLMAVLKRRRVTRDLQLKNPDQYAVARAMIEVTARSFDRGLLSVAFWYCVPALLGYSGIVTVLIAIAIIEMNRVISVGRPNNDAFSLPFRTLDTVVHYIPARLGALLLWIGMVFSPNCHPFSALKCLFKQSHKHSSVNAGWPVSIMAGGLGIALASGASSHKWIGLDKASAKVGVKEIRRALTLHYVSFILSILIISSVLFLSLGA